VAFSRARLGFYVFGDFQCIKNSVQQKKKGMLWVDILKLAEDKKAI
jgi:hypothetical protein